MRTTTSWSAYRPLTAVEQELFQKLLGKELGVEALLVSTNDSEKKFTEYIFMYNHPDPSTPNLVSFYAKVEDKKETVVEFATAQLTATMATSRLVETTNNEELARSVAKKMGVNLGDEATEYADSSQANYFFDCDGNKGNSKGSFCCVLNKGKEYFILTAGHNLSNGTTVGSMYKLIKDNSNYVELELTNDYRPNGYDAAVLKINKIIEKGEGITIDKSNFYINAIKFDNYATIQSTCISPNGTLVGYVSKSGVTNKFRSGESIAYKLKDNSKDNSKDEYEDDKKSPITTYHELFNPGGQSGDSGCCQFIKTDKNSLDGVYRGKINRKDCSELEKLHGICVMYKDINRKEATNRIFLKNEYSLC